MKISSLHIDGFGVWNDKTWEPLAPGVNVFHGPNETGKSTLMAFVRAMLFGFEKRNGNRRYEPLNGGNHGGWLDLEIAGQPVRIERKPGRHVRGSAAVYEGFDVGGDERLESLLAGTTKTLYHNIFAFGLEELEQFNTLQDNEVAPHIAGAATGIGAARWTAVQRDLESRQSALFLPRGQSSEVNVALKELDDVRSDLERTAHQPEDYSTAHDAKIRLGTELQQLEEMVADLKKQVAGFDKRQKARPLMERRRALEASLRELSAVESFPEGGLERLELLQRQLRSLEGDSARILRESENCRRRVAELAGSNDPADRVLRAQVIESLRSLLPRSDATRQIYIASVDRRDAATREKAALGSAMESLRPPSRGSFTAFMVLIWACAAGIAWAGHPNVGAITIASSLVPIFWYRRRIHTFATLESDDRSCTDRLDVSTYEVRRIEAEARAIEFDLRRLIGKDEITQEDVDVRVAELGRLEKIADEVIRLNEAIERLKVDAERVRHQAEAVRGSVSDLLAQAAAASQAEFVERAEIYKRRMQLVAEIEKIPVLGEPGMLFDTGITLDEAADKARADLAEAERMLVEARKESGRVEERISIMERSEERSRALARKESIMARIEEASESWAILTLCRTMLDETRKIHETERQPEVLRQASRFFEIMTAGRYRRVISPLDGNEIQVERADGSRAAPQVLSRGTAEQLYLAMRLALVRDYARHVDPLPVVFDDVLVNFDPERAAGTIEAIGELAKTHQVLVFTCHPHLVRQLQEIVPEASVFPLQ